MINDKIGITGNGPAEFQQVHFLLLIMTLSMHRTASTSAARSTGAAADMPARFPVNDQPSYDQYDDDQKDHGDHNGHHIRMYPRYHIMYQLLSENVFPACLVSPVDSLYGLNSCQRRPARRISAVISPRTFTSPVKTLPIWKTIREIT